MKKFNAAKVKDDLVRWIQSWFAENGNGCHAVVGISGGKDSSVTAALCAAALGKERVIGVLLPDGSQDDIAYARDLVGFLDIKAWEINISDITKAVWRNFPAELECSGQSQINLPPRIRMSVLYAVSQSVNGRVANTSNLSEDWIGYATRYGDTAGDFGPLSQLTVSEVKQIGCQLGLDPKFIEKAPSDGLCGQTDEDNLGFSYEILDQYIRTGVCEDAAVKARIDALHQKNRFKLELMPVFSY